MELVLASQSEDRKKCFERAGIPITVIPSHFDEKSITLTDPLKKINFLAFEKARTVKKIWQEQFSDVYGEALIIAADTVGIFENQLLGKPSSQDQAFRMIQMLSGNVHTVYTAVNIQHSKKNQIESQLVQSTVHFQSLSYAEIRAYIDSTDEYLPRAASYSILNKASLFIDYIEGSFTNIIGLPMAEVRQLLLRFGVELFKQ